MPQEVEIKLRLNSSEKMRQALAELGFRVQHERSLEVNVLFDTAKEELRQRGQLLRLRDWHAKSILTYKGPSNPGRHKSREELELEISDAAQFWGILERLGYHKTFRYEKYRAQYQKPDETGIVTIDETPIGSFLEIEGEPRWIDNIARQLGYDQRDYITASYGALYAEYRQQKPGSPQDMVFLSETLD